MMQFGFQPDPVPPVPGVYLIQKDAQVVALVSKEVWVTLLGEVPVRRLNLLHRGIIIDLHSTLNLFHRW